MNQSRQVHHASIRTRLLWRMVPITVVGGMALVGAAWGLIHNSSPAGVLSGLALGLACLAVMPLLQFLYINRACSRVRVLGEAMHRMAGGDLDVRLEVDGQDEMSLLMQDFNVMVGNLGQAQTAIEEKNEGLRAALEELERLDQAKHDFLTLISHEIRTPLTAIKGGMDYLRSVTADLDPASRAVTDELNMREILEVFAKNTRRLDSFMTDATIMANLQAVDRRLTVNVVPAGMVVADLLQEREADMAGRDLDVTNELDGTTSWDLLGDMDLFGVAMEKLLDNAIEHNHQGGSIVVREVEQIPGLGDADVLKAKVCPENEIFSDGHWNGWPVRWRLVEISNTGTPIPENRRAALFNIFEMVGPMANHQRGSGLSLPIVKTALERMGGGVFFRVPDGGGNAFTLLVPTVDRSVSSGPGPVGTLWHDRGQRKTRVVLDADLNPWDRDPGAEVEIAGAGANGPGCIDSPAP